MRKFYRKWKLNYFCFSVYWIVTSRRGSTLSSRAEARALSCKYPLKGRHLSTTWREISSIFNFRKKCNQLKRKNVLLMKYLKIKVVSKVSETENEFYEYLPVVLPRGIFSFNWIITRLHISASFWGDSVGAAPAKINKIDLFTFSKGMQYFKPIGPIMKKKFVGAFITLTW